MSPSINPSLEILSYGCDSGFVVIGLGLVFIFLNHIIIHHCCWLEESALSSDDGGDLSKDAQNPGFL